MTAPARREQVLNTTMEIVGEQGFQAVSIQSVARRAGITSPVVYAHFGICTGPWIRSSSGRWRERWRRSQRPRWGTWARAIRPSLVLESLRGYLAAVEDHPSTWRLVLTPPEGAPELLRKRIVRGRAEVLKSLTDAVSPGSLPGDLSEDPELTARILSAMADEYARLVLSDPKRFSPERLLEHARWWLGLVAT